MRTRLILSAVATLVMGTEALASGLSYNYVQGGLLGSQIKASGDSDGGAGFRLDAAVSNGLPVFFSFNVTQSKYSSGSDNLKLTSASAGFGGHLPLSSTIDAIGGISYESLRLIPHISFVPPQPGPPQDANPSRGGLGLAAGLRGQYGDKLEWSAGLKYRDIKILKNVIGVSVGGRYMLSPAFTLGVDLTSQKYDKRTLDATESMVAVSFRYQFWNDL